MGGVTVISSRKSSVDKKSGLKRYLYKKVFSKDGQLLGRVKDMVFKSYDVEGILVTKFLFFKTSFIDREYIDKFSEEGILLKINPVLNILGKQVFDKEGRKIGKVKKVNRRTQANAYESLVVKKGIFSRQRLIYPSDVDIVQKNVILRVAVTK
ncbi:hypothetical protein GOV08_02195 [Candidatus Woesearchaeota archaeon]|nr:hypothetical protein [Candidatus Woesearchaeota archaeon]